MFVRGHEPAWWKEGVVYQIYPASFKDSNNDGVGDLPGILSKIDYIKDLGIDIVWICPMYKSPQYDMGYDISDYLEVHAPYGTVKDVEDIIEACHSRGMRLILDLVINHTSDEHPWFQESRSSKDNPKRDWYIWRPAKYTEDGERIPPNNWASFFHGSAWEWDEKTQEYFLHLFAKQQPDLNWENETARQVFYHDAMEFWLKKGIDGFRVDCANMFSKNVEFPDAPVVNPGYFQPCSQFFCNGPDIHKYMKEIGFILKRYNGMSVGELPFTPDFNEVLRYVKSENEELSMVFQFDLVDLGHGPTVKFEFTEWKLSEFKRIVSEMQKFIQGNDGWTTVFCENHDQGRATSRFTSDAPEWRDRSSKLLSLMMCALTGTLFVYQGQEIGMINAPSDWGIEEYLDIESQNHHKTQIAIDPHGNERIMKSLQILARDHGRFPMQWDDSIHSGFTSGKPWMRVHPCYPEINVAAQTENPASVLNFWKKMLKLRKEYKDIFVYGLFKCYDMENEKTFVFVKSDLAAVALNFSPEEQKFQLPPTSQKWKLLIGNIEGIDGNNDTLSGFEGRIYMAV